MVEATVTPIRPAKELAPSRNAAKQRRYRERQKAVTGPREGVIASVTVTPNRRSVWPLAGTTVGLMAVSLTHLSDGVTQLTSIPSWEAWAMAIGIDCMLISVALAQLTSPPDVKRDIALVARCMEAGTLVISAGLNALTFTHWAQVAFGCFVPAAISGATYILARLTRRYRR